MILSSHFKHSVANLILGLAGKPGRSFFETNSPPPPNLTKILIYDFSKWQQRFQVGQKRKKSINPDRIFVLRVSKFYGICWTTVAIIIRHYGRGHIVALPVFLNLLQLGSVINFRGYPRISGVGYSTKEKISSVVILV